MTKDQLGPIGNKYRVTKQDEDCKVGEILTYTGGEYLPFPYFEKENGDSVLFHLTYLEPLTESTLEDMPVGTIVDDETGREQKILFVLKPGLYILSSRYNHECAGEIVSTEDLKKQGYTIKPQTPPKKMTLAEIEGALGYKIEITN